MSTELSLKKETKPKIGIDRILKQVKSYLPNCNTEIIEKAYEWAYNIHKNQFRKSGEPFIIHPVETAYILSQMKLDIPTIAAGLLHDTVEDGDISIEDIEREFGKEIAFIVEGVTKLKHLPKKDKTIKQAENLRKIILAMSKDLRVILVKLADKLHNMRTLQYQPEYKQKIIARETLEIYAPLAARLGIDWLKNELEDLSFKFLYPYEYQRLKAEIEKRIEISKDYVERVKNILKELLEKHNIKGEVLGRVKHLYSIYRKLEKYGLTIDEVNQIYDIIGFRIIVNTVEECYRVLGIVHSKWFPIPGRFKDYISFPKPNMYQSLHTTVVGLEGKKIEIQIRTKEMDRIANEGIAAHFLYKEGYCVSPDDFKQFSWLKKLLELQKELQHPREFLESLKLDLFTEEIYVFTPKGDIIVLPVDATPVDFAYAIHTEVGHHCKRAFVNEKLVPLDYKLQTGDVVRIETSSSQTPSRDWLKFVKTARAKSRIKSWFKKQEKEKFIILGKEILNRVLKKFGYTLESPFVKTNIMDQFLKHFRVKDIETLFYQIGSSKIQTKSLVKVLNNILSQEKKSKEIKIQEEEVFEETTQETKQTDILNIDGTDDILFHLAQCCKPIPGDEVIGYITRGKGISVHRIDCPNIKNLDPERFIEINWNKKATTKTYPVYLYIIAIDRKGLLANITSAIAEAESNILKAHLNTNQNKAYFEVCVEVTDISHLNKVINNISKIEEVVKVERKLVT